MGEWTQTVLGVKLAGCQWGDPKAPGERTLICAHGWQDNAASFAALGTALEQMEPAGWQLIAVDLPGHGLSDHLPPSQFYNLWDFIPLLAAWLELRPGPSWLCGHSMGAMVMTQLAVARPDLTCGLLTLDMLGQSFDVDAEAQVSRLARVLAEQTRGLPGSQPSPDLAHAVRRRMRFGSPATEQANEMLVRRGAEKTPDGWRFRLDPRVRHGSVMRLTTEQVVALGHMIDCPWHVILGEQGLFDPQQVREWQPNWPAVRIQWWPGGHHFHMETQTPALWQTIRQVMDSEAGPKG